MLEELSKRGMRLRNEPEPSDHGSKGVSVDPDYKVLPVVVRHCAWQTTHRHVRAYGKKQIERLRGRPHDGQVSEFAEVNHFRDPQKAADMSKLYDRWSLRLWMGTILVSGEHYAGTPARARRCRSVWRRPEDLRRVKRVWNEMIGDSWNTSPRQEGEATDTMRSVDYSEMTDQVWWPERLHGVLGQDLPFWQR